MTLTDVLQATADRLKELWPERNVHVDEIPQQADGAFYVGLTVVDQTQGLGRWQRRTVGVQVLYLCEDGDTLSYLEWVETMLDKMRYLQGPDRPVGVRNRRAQRDEAGKCYQFLFDVNLTFAEAAPEGEPMEYLDMRGQTS